MAPYLTLGVSWYLNIPAIVLLVLASAASSIGPQVEKEGDTKKRLLNAVSILQIVPLVLVIGLSIFAMLWVGWTVAQTGHMRGNMFGRRLYGLFGEG